MKELESETWCPRCKVYYGKTYRVLYNEEQWRHESEPKFIPKYCTTCEQPTERHYAN